MKNVYVMALEPLETRYTGQWFNTVPKLIEEAFKRENKPVQVVNLVGDTISSSTTAGAFLNFTETNIWKNSQMTKLTKLFADGRVKSGDIVFFTDAWHPGVIQTKYMAELLDIDVKIFSYWHAGSYDPYDFLGRKIFDKSWSYNFERSVFHASDYNVFATHFHVKLMNDQLFYSQNSYMPEDKILISGQPHNAMVETLTNWEKAPKEDIILFPHRVAPEKQVDIFKDLSTFFPDYQFVVCQDEKLSKNDYHNLLARAKVIFSANLQETLGISSCIEGPIMGCIPFVPDRLSYSEIFEEYPDFMYPQDLTETKPKYDEFKHFVVERLKHVLDNYDEISKKLEDYVEKKMPEYSTADVLFKKMIDI